MPKIQVFNDEDNKSLADVCERTGKTSNIFIEGNDSNSYLIAVNHEMMVVKSDNVVAEGKYCVNHKKWKSANWKNWKTRQPEEVYIDIDAEPGELEWRNLLPRASIYNNALTIRLNAKRLYDLSRAISTYGYITLIVCKEHGLGDRVGVVGDRPADFGVLRYVQVPDGDLNRFIRALEAARNNT